VHSDLQRQTLQPNESTLAGVGMGTALADVARDLDPYPETPNFRLVLNESRRQDTPRYKGRVTSTGWWGGGSIPHASVGNEDESLNKTRRTARNIDRQRKLGF